MLINFKERVRFMTMMGMFLYKIKMLCRWFIERWLTASVNGSGRIGGSCELEHPENIYIGDNSFVNGGQLFAGKSSKIIIGNNVMISYNVHIRTTYHNYMDRKIPMNMQGMSEADIVIEDNCWIGHSAQIMPGITIHTGSVVGAGAIVTKDVPSNVVVGGCPASVIKEL